MELEGIRRVGQICFSKYSPTSLIRPKNTHKRESRMSYDNDYKTSNPLVLNLFLCCNHMNILTSFSVSLLPFLMAIALSLIRTHFQFSQTQRCSYLTGLYNNTSQAKSIITKHLFLILFSSVALWLQSHLPEDENNSVRHILRSTDLDRWNTDPFM